MKRLLAVALTLGFCVPTLSAQVPLTAEDMLLPARHYERYYQRAIEQAEQIKPRDMVDFLWGAADDRVTQRGDSMVLVSMAIPESELKQWTGTPHKLSPTTDDPTQMWWVSLDPELGSILLELPVMDSTQAADRINQILGIAPDHFRGFMVNFWVSPEDLFRPSANPDPTLHYSTATLPEGVDPNHKAWIESLRQSAYKGSPTRIWGQLGYSYDWSNPLFPVGVSELVVKPNCEVITESLSSIWNWYTRYIDLEGVPFKITTTTDLPTSEILDK